MASHKWSLKLAAAPDENILIKFDSPSGRGKQKIQYMGDTESLDQCGN